MKIKPIYSENLLDKISGFPGSHILFAFLSASLLLIYIIFFGFGNQYSDYQGPNIYYWNIIAIISFIAGGIWGRIKGYFSSHYATIGGAILILSFLILHAKMINYQITTPIGNQFFKQLGNNQFFSNPDDSPTTTFYIDQIIFYSFAWIVGFICLCKTWMHKNDLRKHWDWLLPLIAISTYIIPYRYIVITSVLLLALTALKTSKFRVITARLAAAICTVAFYLLTIFIYFPFNPFLVNKETKGISISFNPKSCTIVKENNNRYNIINGYSFTGEKIIDADFDCYKKSMLPYNSLFVGYKIDSDNKYTKHPLPQSTIYPIIVTDSCIYFSSHISIYKELKHLSEADDSIKQFTARAFFDYIRLLQEKDSAAKNRLIATTAKLQNILTACATDTTALLPKSEKEYTILCNLTKNMSLGMLNALCLDLLEKNEIVSSVNIFSYQFFFTFYDNPNIYKNTQININAHIEYDISNQIRSFQINHSDLKKTDMFKQWVDVSSLCFAAALQYTTNHLIHNENKAAEILKSAKTDTAKLDSNHYNITELSKILDKVTEANKALSSYKQAHNTEEYCVELQSFLYKCVLNNQLEDYNSFFLNRFIELTPIIPLNPLSTSSFNEFKNLYNNKFNKNIKDIDTLRSKFNDVESAIKESMSLQSDINAKLKAIDELLKNAAKTIDK